MSDEVESDVKVYAADGGAVPDDVQVLLKNLLDAFTRRLPEESLSVRSNLVMVAYEEFLMWSNGQTREEFETAEIQGTMDDMNG